MSHRPDCMAVLMGGRGDKCDCGWAEQRALAAANEHADRLAGLVRNALPESTYAGSVTSWNVAARALLAEHEARKGAGAESELELPTASGAESHTHDRPDPLRAVAPRTLTEVARQKIANNPHAQSFAREYELRAVAEIAARKALSSVWLGCATWDEVVKCVAEAALKEYADGK